MINKCMFKLIGSFVGNIFGGSKLVLIMLAIIAMLAGGGYWYFKWSQSELATLRENAAKLELAVEQQKKTITDLQNFQKRQNQDIRNLQDKLVETESYRKSLEDKFLKHDLEYLAREKPKLIEDRINSATSKILDQIEADTTTSKPAAPVCTGKKCAADQAPAKPPLAGQ